MGEGKILKRFIDLRMINVFKIIYNYLYYYQYYGFKNNFN